MDRAASLISPGSKTLVGWWRQLAPHKPRGLWVGYVYVHRIEAPVEVLRSQPLDPLVLLTLQALDVVPANEIARWLGMPAPVLAGILQTIQRIGLIESSAGDCVTITALGRTALADRSVPVRSVERQSFTFVERLDNAGRRSAPPIYFPLAECARANWVVDEMHRFDASMLQSCIHQPREWKDVCGFPHGVERLRCDGVENEWKQVIIDRPERVMLTLMTTESELIVFGVKVDGWLLNDRTPVLRLPLAALKIAPDLLREPSNADWRDAWRIWCKQRNLPANEVEASTIAFVGPRVEIQAPPRLVQRLQAANSDLLKGEAWLIVGDGFIHAVAPMILKTGDAK